MSVDHYIDKISFAKHQKLIRYGYLLAVLLLLLLLVPDVLRTPQFWAEDGTIFFSEQACYGFKALFVPYAGYYNLIHRLTALSVLFCSTHYSPIIYIVVSILLTVFILNMILSSRLTLPYRSLLALAVGLLIIYSLHNDVAL